MNGISEIWKLLSVAGAVAKPHHHGMLRGGRLRKTGRGVVTYAPWLGMIVTAAMGAGMVMGAGEAAMAQTTMPVGGCAESSMDPGVWTCTGMVATAQRFTIPEKGSLTITGESGFSANVSSGHAFHLDGVYTQALYYAYGATVTLSRSVTASGTGSDAGHGVFVDHPGNGGYAAPLRITTGAVTAGLDGVRVESDFAGSDTDTSIEITVNGAVRAGDIGVHAIHTGDGTFNNLVQPNADHSITITLGGLVAGGV